MLTYKLNGQDVSEHDYRRNSKPEHRRRHLRQVDLVKLVAGYSNTLLG